MRRAGILLHPTSLPGGKLGAPARRFIDWMAAAGVRAWQTLPLVPPGPGASPYCSVAALALDTGLVPQDAPRPSATAAAEYAERAPWARELGLFLALKAEHAGAPFWEWPAALRDRDPRALEAARARHAARIDAEILEQCRAEMAWAEVKRAANDRGIVVIGDLPIYVDLNSVDVWCRRDAFLLDSNARPLAVAGVPPDYFSETGQLWGNPLYDWDRLAASGHDFWVERLRRACALFDIVRIDHFRAFSAYWAVPPAASDARGGEWRKGPGERLFRDLERALGRLPLIAEDLGLIDDEVRALRDTLDLPGMAVLHFAFGGDAHNTYLPHNHKARSIAYTGTHDNDTTLGFWQSCGEHVRDHVRRYYGIDGSDVVWDFIRSALASVAETAIVPMQDILALPSEARMNMPGRTDGNWRWRMDAAALEEGGPQRRLAELISLYGR